MTENRRTASRHEVAIAVTVFVPGESFESKLESTIANLSLGGAFVLLDERLSIGTPMKVRFRIATRDQPIEIGAVVRWTSNEGAGIQFDGLRAAEVFALEKFFDGLPE